jgi:regulator of protease activity HflC (stomatin/prohibitin superfamily)
VADDRARQQEAEARRERKAAKMRAIGQAMQQYGNSMQTPPPAQAPTYRCRQDYAGNQICRPQ